MVSVVGVVLVLLFYIAIVVVGIVAARRFKAKEGATDIDISMVAGRNLGFVVGSFTMAATFVGGGYINGTAEGIARDGLAWTLAPFGIFIGTLIAAILYAPPMRRRCYITMLDPLQECYGDAMTGLLFLGASFADLLWAASILAALGTSLSVILQIPTTAGIIVSTIVGVSYTIFGQMVAVAYTDILQLIFMVTGLVVAVPFAMDHEAVSDIGTTSTEWLGSIQQGHISPWLDFAIIQIAGSIPWQTFFQRVLSAKTVAHAQTTAVIGAFSALLLAIPPVLIGAVGVSTNWTQTELGVSPIETGEVSKILPLVLQYLTPTPIALFGLAAVIAAVMSSLDSIILSSSSMFTHNVYNMVVRPQASQHELINVQRVSLFIAAAIATILAIHMKSVFDMFFLAADMVSVIMLPQLTCALAAPFVNAYGSFFGLFLGLFLRLAGGDKGLGIPVVIKYPYYSENDGQLFPYKTLAMLCALLGNLGVSYLVRFIFTRGYLSRRYDFADCTRTKHNINLMSKESGENYHSQLSKTDNFQVTKF